MEATLIDPRDPTRKWEVTIEPDGRISKMVEIPQKPEAPKNYELNLCRKGIDKTI